MAAGAAIALIVVLGIVVAVIRRRRRARALLAPLPLIPFSNARGVPAPARPDGTLAPTRSASAGFVNAPTPAWAPPVSDAGVESAARSPYAPTSQVPTGARRAG